MELTRMQKLIIFSLKKFGISEKVLTLVLFFLETDEEVTMLMDYILEELAPTKEEAYKITDSAILEFLMKQLGTAEIDTM